MDNYLFFIYGCIFILMGFIFYGQEKKILSLQHRVSSLEKNFEWLRDELTNPLKFYKVETKPIVPKS